MDWFVWLQVGKGEGKEMKGEEEPKTVRAAEE